MGKVYETLRQNGMRLAPVEEKALPFCPPEARRRTRRGDPVHRGRRPQGHSGGFPEVLASMVVPANKPQGTPRREEAVAVPGVRAVEPAKETALRVVYCPLSPEATLPPAHLRFAPGLVAFHQPDSPAARQYQALAHTLGLLAGDSRVVLFTAPASGSGATTVLLNLAVSVARQNRPRVAVMDANFLRPDVALFLGLPDRPGCARCCSARCCCRTPYRSRASRTCRC
jgi:hypothetical protein